MKVKAPTLGKPRLVNVPVTASKSAVDDARAPAPAPTTGFGHKAAAEAFHAPGRSPTPAHPPALLSVEATALELSVCAKTVRRLIARGSLPCCRVGRLVRIRAVDLAQFVAPGTEG